MNNFTYRNPTKIIFGKGQIATLKNEIPKNAKVLLLYGGGSIKKNGIYEQVITALQDYEVVEFGGVPANPEYQVAMKAVELIKKENINYMLAVGGGSVIDAAKFISIAIKYTGNDPWDLLINRIQPVASMPFGVVLTLPATGSEMNSVFVLSRREQKEKRSLSSPLLFPQFSVLDPTVVVSIPKRQLVNGIIDAFNHTLEQYMTYPIGADLQDRFAESILSTLINNAVKIIENQEDYKIAANFMWSCTMALNGLISQGVPTDWAIHAIGHELTALYGIDHARTLAIVGMPHYRYHFKAKKEKLVQYAERVWNISQGTEEEKAMKAIEKTEAFYHLLGVKTRLSEYTSDFEMAAEEIQKRFEERGWKGIGEHRSLTPKNVAEIVKMSY